MPLAWREAFDTGRDRSVSGIGNLLMSMNAHINRDFPYLVEALGMTKPDGSTRKVDHDRGNRVLHPLYDDVLRELSARFDRSISDYDVPGLFADDVALFQILQGWREGVWRNAELLRNARTPAQRKAVSDVIEQYALSQARLIRANTTIRSSAARDAQCAEYRRTHRERGGKAKADKAKRGNRVSRKRRVKVRVRCPEAVRDCRGRLALMRGKRTLGGTTLPVIRAGRSKVVTVKPGAQAAPLTTVVSGGRLAVALGHHAHHGAAIRLKR